MARTTGRLRGDALLLTHLGALERLTNGRAVSARERLEERLGRDEAARLIRAVTPGLRPDGAPPGHRRP